MTGGCTHTLNCSTCMVGCGPCLLGVTLLVVVLTYYLLLLLFLIMLLDWVHIFYLWCSHTLGCICWCQTLCCGTEYFKQQSCHNCSWAYGIEPNITHFQLTRKAFPWQLSWTPEAILKCRKSRVQPHIYWIRIPVWSWRKKGRNVPEEHYI